MRYTIAVRALCEFTAKVGDLDLRFTPGPTAQQGIAGHQRVVERRDGEYQAELPLAADFDELHVRGRADGYAPLAGRLEEIKTFRGALERMPANQRTLHWAQVKVYGALLCRERGLSDIELALVYFDVSSEREHCLTERFSAEVLWTFFTDQCERFLQWARQELRHTAERNQALTELTFPHPRFREGQRALAEAVFKTARTGRCLLAQAPTGIGKTIGTLFPLLKAWGPQQLDRIFFLTAKTPGRRLALDALQQLQTQGAQPLRVLELVARDKACEHPDNSCNGDSCPLARGFYDRLPAARATAASQGLLTQQTLRDIALAHGICPYWLGFEMARWCDVVVGDYNYYFDTSALLHGLTAAQGWHVALLVDEAHNLVERARGMYSAELDGKALRRAARNAPAPLKKALNRVTRQWGTVVDDLVASSPGPQQDYRQLAEPPAALLATLQGFSGAVTDWLTEQPAAIDPELQQLFFDVLQFCQVAEQFDAAHYVCDAQLSWDGGERSRSLSFAPAKVSRTRRPALRLALRNVIPAEQLAPRFQLAQSTVLFSATVRPTRYFSDLLGLPPATIGIDVDSPFTSDQLAITVTPLSTRYRDRDASVGAIVALVADQYRARPGNYLLFTSSFAHLAQISAAMARVCPDIDCWTQTPQMREADRNLFLERFSEGGAGVGLAVLGGAFGEGIDLPGTRLIGAFVATLGLPQLNPVNEAFRRKMQQLFGDGWRYTYLFPGIQKVVQAAGRVIRSESDNGVLHLIDDRYLSADVQALLPAWWRLDPASQPFSGTAVTAMSSPFTATSITSG